MAEKAWVCLTVAAAFVAPLPVVNGGCASLEIPWTLCVMAAEGGCPSAAVVFFHIALAIRQRMGKLGDYMPSGRMPHYLAVVAAAVHTGRPVGVGLLGALKQGWEANHMLLVGDSC